MAPDLYRVRKRKPSKAVRKSKRLEQATKVATTLTDVNPLPSPQSDLRVRAAKRKRVHETDHPSCDEPPLKRDRVSIPTSPSEDPYIRWEDYFGDWPPRFSEQAGMMTDPRATKRSRTPSRSNSYSQSVRDGESPVPWTRQHEEKMQEAGLFMAEYQERAKITDECRQLCNTLLEAEYPLPGGPSFKKDRLARVVDRARFRNETRVVRDVLPIVVPSPELLHIDGHAGLHDVCEAMNAEWTQCDTLCGPRPKPDFVGGIAPSAFTDEEKDKLRLNHTSACPSLFPENMYFPFLICEVKSSDRPLQEAERQAMHSASIAVRAVIQLHRKVSAVTEVHRKVLAFSISHNDSTVKIFGHFAMVEGEKTTFFRHRLYSADFAADLASTEWARAYKITRAIYENFFPQHLSRIKSALSSLRGPSLASLTTQLGLVEDSQGSTPSRTSSQEYGRFKKPSLPSTTILQQENDRLRERLSEVLAQQREQMEQQKEQMAQQREIIELLKESKSK